MTAQADRPFSIDLVAVHIDTIAPRDLAKAYVRALHEAGFGEVVEVGFANGDPRPGTEADLYTTLDGAPDAFTLSCRFADGPKLRCYRWRGTDYDDHRWEVSIQHDRDVGPTEAWMTALVQIARAALEIPELQHVMIARDVGGAMKFVPQPPLARANHLVTVTEQQVAERYDDPAVFWRVWETVEAIGDKRLCIRHLDALDEEDWLARSFDDAMDLARAAKPKLTAYTKEPYYHPDYAPWWDPGDWQDEKAGYPALTLVGYIEATKTVEFSGVLMERSEQASNQPPHHVLIIEILTILRLVARKRTQDKRPVETVRVVFAAEWMARQERRPLLDVGARVYYLAATGDLVEVTD
jgi:hypothetical protein